MTRQAQLKHGTIHYTELGSGRPLVFVHGILAGPELWQPLAELLADQFRCILPTWPLGTHPEGFDRDADLSPAGVAKVVAEFLDVLELDDVVLVGNDSGGAICQLVCADHTDRVGGLVLTNCDALEVFPPKMFAYLRWVASVPGAFTVLAKTVNWAPFLRNLPLAWGGLSRDKKPALYKRWAQKVASNSDARADAKQFMKGVNPSVTTDVAERLGGFTKPALLLWGADDGFFPPELAERLAQKLPDARLELIEDAKTFVSLDQPEACATRIKRFARTEAAA